MVTEANDRWLPRLNAISGLLAAVFIPVVIVLVGQRYTTALKEREIQSRFVELALGVLKEPPRAEHRAVREWAVEVVDRYSGVSLSEKAKRELVDSIAFPSAVTSNARVYLLAGRREKAAVLDSLRGPLARAGFNIVGQNPAFVDETRTADPEVRYFNDADRAQAEAIAERLRAWLRAPRLAAQYYRDPGARPGYIEIWLGR